jgi:putative CocE/NonD family hydrolase
LVEEEKRWFDYWLKGIDNGVMDEPPIKIFVMGANEWRFEKEWPLARTLVTPYYLHSDGSANSLNGDGRLSLRKPAEEPADRYDYDPDQPVPSIGGNLSTVSWSWTETGHEVTIAGPVDQRVIERRQDVLVYTGEVLDTNIEVTGPVEVILYAASSAQDTDFTARLVDVFPSGQSIVMAEGIIRARYRNGYDKTELLEPRVVQKYSIELYPTSNVFKKGHRLRVDISSSNFPRFARNLNTGEDVATGTRMQVAHQTVFHSSEHPSHIVLPIVPG